MMFLAIFSYMMIGWFICAIIMQFDKVEVTDCLFGCCLALWPLVLFVLLLLGIVALIYKLGEAIGKLAAKIKI